MASQTTLEKIFVNNCIELNEQRLLITKLKDIVCKNDKDKEIFKALKELELSFIPDEKYHLSATVRDFIKEVYG